MQDIFEFLLPDSSGSIINNAVKNSMKWMKKFLEGTSCPASHLRQGCRTTLTGEAKKQAMEDMLRFLPAPAMSMQALLHMLARTIQRNGIVQQKRYLLLKAILMRVFSGQSCCWGWEPPSCSMSLDFDMEGSLCNLSCLNSLAEKGTSEEKKLANKLLLAYPTKQAGTL
eukprot:7283547-Lingulodinium_polyedra.AAC.1